MRALPVAMLALLLGACAAGPGAVHGRAGGRAVEGIYHVQPGDTLYSIALRFRLDPRQLAAWNDLGDGSRIYPGQALRLASGASTTPAGPKPAHSAADTPGESIAWQWPTEGPVVPADQRVRVGLPGIEIAGEVGQPVRAAAAGEVVYAGSGLPGYGQLIILRHGPAYLSAYGYNDVLMVREGEQVGPGQVIARMGQGPGRRAMLHFEIRRAGIPVEPGRLLPVR